MQLSAEDIVKIFQDSVVDWHKQESIHANPYPEDSVSYLIYHKNQIDSEQWNMEDIIRIPDLEVDRFIATKRTIDKLNQQRVDTVEKLDDYVYKLYSSVEKSPDAKLNSETPAWLIDRMSILELKIYHMQEQTERTDASAEHTANCQNKLDILLEQRSDLTQCLKEMIQDLQAGTKYMKVYRQMKMYNDKNLNPSLYQQSNK
ncbi:MAG: DUF4254 domain-containing protein [Spirochaetota bacterium]